MPWFRVDDTLPLHPKVLAAGNGAMGLWVRAGAWCMQHLQDGFVPEQIARQLGTRAEIKRLCDAGLWIAKGDGYEFHEWSQRQPSRAKLMAEREATAARVKRWRERRQNNDGTAV